MARRHYLVEGGKLQCDKGTALGEIIVTSHQKVKIKGKFKATSADKTCKPAFFGSCACANNSPCAPVLQEWQFTSKKSRMGSKTFVMKDSQIQCSKGGMVTVKDVGQTLVGTGKDDPELDKDYAKLQGEIIFANGYLSQSLGASLNAILDLNPDDPNPNLKRGHNVDEKDKINKQDILLARKIQESEEMSTKEKKKEADTKKIEIKIKYPIFMMPPFPRLPSIPITIKVKKPVIAKEIPELTLEERVEMFWGYWNSKENNLKASKTYAHHFNAGTHQHFLNGSHGLASNGAHRLDHGLAQGYHWAEFQWGILPKENVDATKKKVPHIKSFSPAYKPITIVMHSQGNAPGAGFALGVLKYANELGWEQVPLNLIFLAVHQPQNLWSDDYDKFLNQKVTHYIADTNFWDTISDFEKTLFLSGDKYVKGAVILKEYLTKKEDKNIFTYLNGMSELFSPKYHKLRHKRGIYEHLQAITSFDALKERAVQFTFSNDRGDMVIRDGDIPEIDSACNPKIDSTLYCVEFFPKGQKVPVSYTSNQGKEVIAMENGGHLVIPAYAAIPRIIYDNKTGKKKYWKNYRTIAKDWGHAMSTYKKRKREYTILTKQKLNFLDLIIPGHYVGRKSATAIKKLQLKYWFRKVIYHYARIQMADLYAHFSPVAKITNNEILNLGTQDFNDDLGNETIWNRIKKAGEQKFYRVEYGKEDKTEAAKRESAKKYVEGDSQNLLINTNIANTPYISKVIKAYVHGDTNAEKQLYKEPAYIDAETERLQKMFGLTGKELENKKQKYQEALLKELEVKKDKIPVVKPKK